MGVGIIVGAIVAFCGKIASMVCRPTVPADRMIGVGGGGTVPSDVYAI